MELKGYQKNILSDLRNYLYCLDEEQNLINGWSAYWSEKNISEPLPYKNQIAGVPNVCFKVPTGGGKTFLACAALKKIFRGMRRNDKKFVVWLVPSDSILTQTIAALSDDKHPYRERLEKDFGGHVEVFSKDMLLNAQNFSPTVVEENLCICVLSYASLRIDSKKKDVRKVYQENGALKIFDAVERDFGGLLKNTPESALIQIVRKFNPVVVVDESHNAGSKLSVEMLNIVNPAFILELTATPRTTSNIISYVDARELKAENMVKLPVLVKNCADKNEVLTEAIKLRNELENQSRGGDYIRPIVLFQAQPNVADNSETFGKIKADLIASGIPAAQIAIKTSNVNELQGVDLMSRACPIRYIITVNALKEGWDCPFAYILASLTNKNSTVDVEQIVGRILRQPHARPHARKILNASFVFTCSRNFFDTLESVVRGLNNAGFSRKACRAVDEPEPPVTKPVEQLQLIDAEKIPVKPENPNEDLMVGDTEAIKREIENSTPEKISETIETFSGQIETFERENNIGGKEKPHVDIPGQESFPMQEQFAASARALKLPQFLERTWAGLFGDATKLLERENLSSGFSLKTQDAQIDFSFRLEDLYKIDLQEQGEAVPTYSRVSSFERKSLNNYLKSLPPERKIRECAARIAAEINRNNRYSFSDVKNYVKRIIDGMTPEELAEISARHEVYALLIRKKIDTLERNYQRENFRRQVAGGNIFCDEFYTLPENISLQRSGAAIPKGLYAAEARDMNKFEQTAINALAGLENVIWWHRNAERREFRLNGWLNHYPDFILQTRAGNVILVETKGEHLANDDSKEKLALGREWQAQAGRNYRYFMVFDGASPIENAFSLNEFLNVMETL